MEKQTTVERTLYIDAPPGVVWRAMTDTRLIRLYRLNSSILGEWRKGETIQWFELKDGKEVLQAKGRLMEMMPGHRLRHTNYNPASGLPDEPANYTTVDITLDVEKDGRTRLQLWQGEFAGLPHAERMAREAGRRWVEALVGLKRVAEEEARDLAA